MYLCLGMVEILRTCISLLAASTASSKSALRVDRVYPVGSVYGKAGVAYFDLLMYPSNGVYWIE